MKSCGAVIAKDLLLWPTKLVYIKTPRCWNSLWFNTEKNFIINIFMINNVNVIIMKSIFWHIMDSQTYQHVIFKTSWVYPALIGNTRWILPLKYKNVKLMLLLNSMLIVKCLQTLIHTTSHHDQWWTLILRKITIHNKEKKSRRQKKGFITVCTENSVCSMIVSFDRIMLINSTKFT